MAAKNRLHLYEEIMLLALRDKEGTVASGSMFNFAVGGAILAELLMEKRIGIEAVRKKTFAKVLDALPLGDPLIDEGLTGIAQAKRRRSLQFWVGKFAGMRNIKHRAAVSLVRRGILRVDEGKILGLFTRKIYPEVDPRPEREIIERLHRAIFGESGEVEPRTVVLLSLANGTDLLKLVFDKKELKGRKARIKQVTNGELTGKATREAIQAMQAAVIAACVIPAVMVSTTAGH